MTTRAVEALKEVASILNAKAPQEAAAMKGWLSQIAQTIAEASGDGFMGFGGVQVSAVEKATIEDIKKALGTS